jgi:hypothetical protein
MKTNKAVYWAVSGAVRVSGAVYRDVYWAVSGAVTDAVSDAVNRAVYDSDHPALQDFLVSCGAEV